MSSAPQTSAPQTTGRPKPRSGLLLSFGLALAVVGIALGPRWAGVARTAAAARPHLPDAAALAQISPMIAVHVVAAAAALALGAALMLVRKGRAFHRIAGWFWVVLVAVVAISSLFITTLNPGRLSLLHLFTGWTLVALPLGVVWARRRRTERHRRMMTGLFYGAFVLNSFIAFLPGRTLWRLVFG